jgi:hypothetical protein
MSDMGAVGRAWAIENSSNRNFPLLANFCSAECQGLCREQPMCRWSFLVRKCRKTGRKTSIFPRGC